ASCRQSKPDRRPGSPNATRGWCWIGSALPTRTGDSTLAAGATGARTFSRFRSSHQLDDVPGGVAAPFLEQVRAFQLGLVARDEQDGGSFVVAVDVLEPGAAGHCEIVEFLPVETLAVDDRVSLALEWSDQQARGLPHRARFLAGAQHLREECHGL